MSGSSTDPPGDAPREPTGDPADEPMRDRTAAVKNRLDRVEDPELARSIVALDYIDAIEIDGDRVEVRFTLPTAWCSPAFAWMMATDARDEVESLDWVEESRIELCDHMHGAEITAGVNARDTFGATFPDADGDVAAVRASIADKARVSTQREAITALLDAGVDPEQVVALDRSDVEVAGDEAHVALDGLSVVVDAEPIADYLDRVEASGHVGAPDDTLFLTPEGDPIPADRLDVVQKRSRLASVNMGGQGAVCDALHRARHGPDGPDGTGASYVDRSEGDLSAYDGDVDEFTSAWTAGVDD
ncbi:iron-sulfur cluster assembly protein [Halorubrum sp. SS5]|uniref:iron-sulfur cluster assembly protein n=1 Tax=Halorubrum sp. SS7 TaxID=2518119 RepID=UPI0010F83D68|nr:iron-sulfur cluster assembly protein [Halorubrum sp. SS7]TKX59929.1 iron-sulfur cluster assembly protein [Halorubrum sp. SS7]TKX86700.1 iron-sulfur cluster assembly protein [Halorubrum sp. SS5]